MEKNVEEILSGFESVWKRVEAKENKKNNIPLMPGKNKTVSSCRFIAGYKESVHGGNNEHRA